VASYLALAAAHRRGDSRLTRARAPAAEGTCGAAVTPARLFGKGRTLPGTPAAAVRIRHAKCPS
jgi:hypothetical protein